MTQFVIPTAAPQNDADPRQRREDLINMIAMDPHNSSGEQQELLEMCRAYQWPVAGVAVDLLKKGVKLKYISTDFTTGRVSGRMWPEVQACHASEKFWGKARKKAEAKIKSRSNDKPVITTDAWVTGEKPKHLETIRFGALDEELHETAAGTGSGSMATIGQVCVA